MASVIQGKIKTDDKMIGSTSKLITSNVYNLQGEKVGYLKVNARLGGKSKVSSMVSSQVSIPKESKIVHNESSLV